MISIGKIRGLLRNLPLKVKKKNQGHRYRNGGLQRYGNPSKGFGRLTSKNCPKWFAYLAKLQKRFFPKNSGRSYLSRSENRKKRWRKLCLISSAGLCIVAAVYVLQKPVQQYLTTLELFRIKDIDIKGYQVTDPEEVKKIAGIDHKTSMFSVSNEQIAQDIANHPWIDRVEVKKVWPDGIRIAIQEHRAVSLMVTGMKGQEKMVYITKKGEVIAPVLAGDDLDYPTITGVNNFDQEDKDRALADAVTFLKLISYNNPNLPAQSVSEIYFDPIEGMVVRLVDFPFPIYFGRGDIGKKYKQLRSVLAVLYKKQKNNFDISEVEYIRVNYLEDKVLVAQSNSG